MSDPDAVVETIQLVFTADHQQFNVLGRALVVALEAKNLSHKQAIWNELRTALLLHLSAEEEFMVPALGRARPRDARAILAEHRLIRERVREIDAIVGEFARMIDLAVAERIVATFVAELDAHARHEERLFSSWVEGWLDDKERVLLFAYRDGASNASSAASSSSTFTGLVR
jgi:hemerythrin